MTINDESLQDIEDRIERGEKGDAITDPEILQLVADVRRLRAQVKSLTQILEDVLGTKEAIVPTPRR